MEQNIIILENGYSQIDEYIQKSGIHKILLVCDESIVFLRIAAYFKDLESRNGIQVIRFSNFKPNPCYESVVKGVEVFLQEACDTIFAVGGGSAIDVAKCIKLYSNMDHSINYLSQEIIPNEIKLIALPTTAGTGSEATKYAVIYYNEIKQSVVHDSIIPSTVIFDPTVLTTLPVYQKKATLMDAFCHAIESFWSINSNEISKKYSREAIKMIVENWEEYIAGNENKNQIMLTAANIAGKAINITQTTAGHAMCYKLTSLYGIAHGHAAGLCVLALWGYMIRHMEDCIDIRGQEYLNAMFQEMAEIMGCDSIGNAIKMLSDIISRIGLRVPHIVDLEDFNLLKGSVNPVRLKNNPIRLSIEAIDEIYHKVFEETEI